MRNQGKKAPEEPLSKAKRLRSSGDLAGEAQILLRLVEEYPDDMDLRFSCASVLFHLRRFAEAAPHFERIALAQPLNEWASLGLFHSLWQTYRRQEAIKEARRFFDAGGESMEYRRFVKEIRQHL